MSANSQDSFRNLPRSSSSSWCSLVFMVSPFQLCVPPGPKSENPFRQRVDQVQLLTRALVRDALLQRRPSGERVEQFDELAAVSHQADCKFAADRTTFAAIHSCKSLIR